MPLPLMVGVSRAAVRLPITMAMMRPLVGGVQDVLEYDEASVLLLMSGLADTPKLAKAIATKLPPK
jgi:hypothetical protein